MDEKKKLWMAFCISLAAVLIFTLLDNFTASGHVIPNYVKYVVTSGLIYAIACLGINFHSGYIGETSLGHAAFFGIGAYTTAYLSVYQDVSFWLTVPLGMILSMCAAFPVALAGRRVKGSFMVVITYAFSEVLRYIAINTKTQGVTSGVPTPTILGTKLTKLPFLPSNKDGYILILYALLVLCVFFTYRVVHSRVGYAFAAIREDEIAATAMGIDTKRYKLLAISISAMMCALAGSFQAVFASMVAPDLLSATLSITIFTMLVVGGRRSIKGAIAGAFIVVLLPELLRSVQGLVGLPFDPWYILYGLMLVLMMRFKPEGLLGEKE